MGGEDGAGAQAQQAGDDALDGDERDEGEGEGHSYDDSEEQGQEGEKAGEPEETTIDMGREEEVERAATNLAAFGEGGGAGEGGEGFVEEPSMKDMSIISVWKIEKLIIFCALAYRLVGGGNAGH